MKKIALSIFCSLVIALGGFYFTVLKPALANVTCSLPFTLTNGTIADATQVMANYNALVTCLTNAAAAGANNDITSLSGLSTPITPNQGGSNVFIGTSPTASGADLTIASTTPANYSNTRGYTVIFTAVATNTSVQTLSVNAQTKKNIFKQSTAGPIPLSGGEIIPNQQYLATYDGTQFQINPVPSLALGWGLQATTATLTGINLTNPPYGYDSCVNMAISATVGSGLLGVQLLAADTGLAPTALHPILCPFRDSTIANGGPVWTSIVSPVYMDTNAVGATFGTVTTQAFRLWVNVFNNGGTPTLSLWQSTVATSNVFTLQESAVQSTTGASNASTNAGVFYTPNGTSLSSKSFRIAGYMDWASGLATVGNYASGPTTIQLFGPGIKRPGEVLQQVFVTSTATSSTSNTYSPSATPPTAVNSATVLSQSMTPLAAMDVINVNATGVIDSSAGSTIMTFWLGNNTTAVAAEYKAGSGSNTVPVAPITLSYSTRPNATSAIIWTTYGAASATIACINSVGNCTSSNYFGNKTGSTLIIQEIQP